MPSSSRTLDRSSRRPRSKSIGTPWTSVSVVRSRCLGRERRTSSETANRASSSGAVAQSSMRVAKPNAVATLCSVVTTRGRRDRGPGARAPRARRRRVRLGQLYAVARDPHRGPGRRRAPLRLRPDPRAHRGGVVGSRAGLRGRRAVPLRHRRPAHRRDRHLLRQPNRPVPADVRGPHRGPAARVPEVYLDLQNATDRANAEELVYSTDFSTRTAIKGLPILPVLGARWAW